MTIKNLLEEFLVGLKRHNKYYEIFINPNSHEIDEVAETFNYKGKAEQRARGLADNKNKKVYVFSATLLHDEAIDFLKKEGVELCPLPKRLFLFKENDTWRIDNDATPVNSTYKVTERNFSWIEEVSSIRL